MIFYASGLLNRGYCAIAVVFAGGAEAYEEATGGICFRFPLIFAQALLLPLQGFGNALVYGKLVPRLYNVCGSRLRVRTSATSPSRRSAFPGRVMQQLSFHEVEPQLLDDQDTSSSTAARVSTAAAGPDAAPRASLKLFCASYNLGEAAPPTADELRRWLPRGRDVYCVALQECLAPDAFAAALCAAVDGDYVLSRRSLGSARKELGYHGFIALFVLVERRHVTSMAWQELTVAHSTVRRGKKVLGIRALTAANKGAVGTACRFHGTTIAFVGAHLNSDKRGVSKLEKRIRDTRYVCEGIELGFDALGFGLEACVHHVILLGDLNFRVGLPLGTALERMAHGRWESLLAADELSTAMAQRRVLSGWREAPIAFLPTYRRRPAVAPPPVAVGDADEDGGDGLGATAGRRSLSDAGAAVAALEAAYTLHVDGSERTPSYTDRVLLHSLPGLEPQLTCVDYDACELLTASDHRPVAADLVLSVPAAAGAAAGADAARSPRRHSLVVRGGGSLRCQLRLSELTLHDDDAAERLALFPMSSVADGAAVEPSLGERASSLPLVPPGSLAEAANEIGPPPRGLSALDARALELAFPMPAEDPSASMNRVAALFGRQGRGALAGGAVGGRARRWRHRRRRPRDCARPRRPRDRQTRRRRARAARPGRPLGRAAVERRRARRRRRRPPL